MEGLTVKQIVEAIGETWDDYGKLGHPELTSTEMAQVANFLDYLAAMVEQGK